MSTAQHLATLAWQHYWQLSVLVVLATLAGRLLRRRSPEVQNVLWAVVFVKAVTPPLWSANFGLFSWTQVTLAPGVAASPVRAGWLLEAAGMLFWVWLAGFVLAVAVHSVRLFSLRRTMSYGCVPREHPIAVLAETIASELGLRRAPRVVVSCDNVGPAVFGLTRTTILLPAALVAEHDKAILRPILAHELLHARRGDTIVAALQALASCVWWHHPLIWWAVRESNRNTERCVDRGAITIPWVLGRDYARALMRVVELRTPPLPANGLVGLCSADITAERLRDVFAQLKRPAPRRAKVVKAQQWLLAIALAAAVLPTRPLVLFTAGEGVSRDCLPSADAADLSAALPESRDAR